MTYPDWTFISQSHSLQIKHGIYSKGRSRGGSELKCAVESKLTHQVLENIHVRLFRDVLYFSSSRLSQLLLPHSDSISRHGPHGSGFKLKRKRFTASDFSTTQSNPTQPAFCSLWWWITHYFQIKKSKWRHIRWAGATSQNQPPITVRPKTQSIPIVSETTGHYATLRKQRTSFWLWVCMLSNE